MTGRCRRKGPARLRVELLEPRIVLAAQPIITEFMAKNDGFLRDGDGRSSDWVEIFNAGDAEIDLQGYHLTDDPADLAKWSFPSKLLPPGAFLVVFASDRAEPDYIDADGFMHTTYALSAGGEYIGLVAPEGNVVSQFGSSESEFPPQKSNVAYGIAQPIPDDGNLRVGYLGMPTPGSANVAADQVFDGFVQDVIFSTQRGFYDAPFMLNLSTATPDASIRFTTDGSQPTMNHGIPYASPISVTTTTPLRAIAFRNGLLPTSVATQTFVFLDDVIRQTGDGLPETWGVFPFGSTEAVQGSPVPANYEMDPEVVNDPRYSDTIRDDLKSLPTLSISMDPDDLWNEDTGIYSNTMERGLDWERSSSVELFDAEGNSLFHVDSGIRLHGGFGRRPSGTAKHSFRLVFRGEYGSSKLDYPWFGQDQVREFDTIVLRANYNYSWARGNRGGQQTGKDYTVVTDRWAAETQREMHGVAPHGAFVHLYINGLYWGIYNPTERPDASFLSEHFGGPEELYDVVAHDGLVDGNLDSWNDLQSRARSRDYESVKQILDVDNYIDYMLLNQYGGNFDWPQNNWYASRPRTEDGKWQFHSWDAEFFFVDDDANRISSIDGSGPGSIFVRLRRDPEFQIDFADRIYKHLFNDGALTQENNVRRLNSLAAIVDRAVVGESARWGDAWMDQVEPARTRDDDWIPRIAELNEEYFPMRGDLVLSQYQRIGLFPDILPPELSQFGGEILPDFELGVTNPNESGAVWYTVDGSDPRLPGGNISPSAIELQGGTISLAGSPTVKLRVLNGDVWSAISEAKFRRVGDIDGNGLLEPADIDLFCQRDNIDGSDLLHLVNDQLNSSIGDANLDGLFNSTDLVQVFQAAKFETDEPATWATGDWNCDFRFSSSDFVWAFANGSYVQAALPEVRDIISIDSIDRAFALVVLRNSPPDLPTFVGRRDPKLLKTRPEVVVSPNAEIVLDLVALKSEIQSSERRTRDIEKADSTFDQLSVNEFSGTDDFDSNEKF